MTSESESSLPPVSPEVLHTRTLSSGAVVTFYDDLTCDISQESAVYDDTAVIVLDVRSTEELLEFLRGCLR